jgi:hypothetical protein
MKELINEFKEYYLHKHGVNPTQIEIDNFIVSNQFK